MSKIAGTIKFPDTDPTKKVLRGDNTFWDIQSEFDSLATAVDDLYAGQANYFQGFADVTTPNTSTTVLLTTTVAGNKLGTNGDSIRAFYSGVFAANNNDKYLYPSFGGTDLTGLAPTTQNGGLWVIDLELIRASASVVRVFMRLFYGGDTYLEYKEITGLTLSSSNNLALVGRTPSNAGDLTLRHARGEFRRAA